jgi:hypothetical protein
LAEASPAQRLKLLEDFAGTTIHKVTFISSLFCLRLLILFVRQPPFRKPFPCGLFIKSNIKEMFKSKLFSGNKNISFSINISLLAGRPK